MDPNSPSSITAPAPPSAFSLQPSAFPIFPPPDARPPTAALEPGTASASGLHHSSGALAHIPAGTLSPSNRVPGADLLAFSRLPCDVRREVDTWLSALSSIQPPIVASLRSLASQFGVSYQTAIRKYYTFKNSGGDWRTLINQVRAPQAGPALPPEFLEYWRSLCQRYQRCSRPAWRELLRQWKSGAEIPGYDPETRRRSLPEGWSYRNLIRYQPTKLDLAISRVGLQYAAPHLPKVFTTRAGLYVGSHYMFDDLWHDHFCRLGAARGRPLEFHALDVFSACKIAWGMRLRLRLADGTMEGLKENEMRFLLASLLFREGYSPRGTVLVVEHGTAAVRQDIERLLHDRTGGAVTVSRSGIIGEQAAIAGLYGGAGKGNFRFKACLESLGNLVHNEMSGLEAQTGKDVEHRPEQLPGLFKECTALARALASLAPDRLDMLLWPLLDFHKFLDIAGEIYRRINNRIEHDLEGWHAAGLTTEEYRLSPDTDEWLPMHGYTRLRAAEQAALTAHIHADARFSRSRNLSPWEVWRRGHPDLVRIPPFVVGEILGPGAAVERKLIGGYFEFQDQAITPDELRFEGRILTADHREAELPEDTYLTACNPFDPEQLLVHDAKGRYLGLARRDHRISRADTEAITRRCGRVAGRVADLLAPARARASALARERIARDAHNARVIGVSPAPFSASDAEKVRTDPASLLEYEPTAADLLGD